MAGALGLPEDQVRLTLLLLGQLPLCWAMQRLPGGLRLHYSNVASLAVLLHMFGARLLAMPLLHSAVVYGLVRWLPYSCGKPVFIYSLASMTATHFHRMWVNYGGWDLDISMVLMIYVCKFTYFAFNVQDSSREDGLLTPEQVEHRLPRTPSFFMFLSYLLFLPCNLLGPVHEYKEFAEYLAAEGKFGRVPFLASVLQVGKKLAFFAVLLVVYLEVHVRRFPLAYLYSEQMQQDPLWAVVASIMVSVTFIKYKYYAIWTLSEAVVTASGFSYAPELPGDCFRGVCHFDYFGVEIAASIKVNVDNWNISVQKWLKSCGYYRIFVLSDLKGSKGRQEQATLMVLTLSAVWHGLYLGYYASFFVWCFCLFLTKLFFKADQLFPRFYRLYRSLGPAGVILPFVASKISFNFFGVYFQILSLDNAMRILRRTYAVPELFVLCLYLVMSNVG